MQLSERGQEAFHKQQGPRSRPQPLVFLLDVNINTGC